MSTAATHDFTRPTWGHAVHVHAVEQRGQVLRVTGHGPFLLRRPRVGDLLKLPTPDGEGTHYKVADIAYYADPQDMWKATLWFPRDLSEPVAADPSPQDGAR